MLKQTLITLLTVFVLFSCSDSSEEIFETTSPQNIEKELVASKSTARRVVTASQPVKLFKAFSNAQGYRGLTSYSKSFTVQVADFAFDKKVSIWHKKLNGEWFEIPLRYERKAWDGVELWVGGFSSRQKELDTEFTVKYEVNGNTYWDNNNGQNYQMTDNDGTLLGEGLTIFASRGAIYNGMDKLFISADVKNIGYAKEVKVVYTTDNWNTVNTQPLSFTRGYLIGYSWIQSPNVHNIERWHNGSIDLPAGTTEVEYAIFYKVNGQEYWDNNFGANYKIFKP